MQCRHTQRKSERDHDIRTHAVQAHATAHRVALFYAAGDAARAAYLKDWDSWRAAGIAVEPCYLTADDAAAGVGAAGAGASGNGAGGGAEPQAVHVRTLLSPIRFTRSPAWNSLAQSPAT